MAESLATNPWHWREVLGRLGDVHKSWPHGYPDILAIGPAGVPVLDPAPPEITMPFRALARQAFVANPHAALAVSLLDVRGWQRNQTEPERRVGIVIPVRGAHEQLRLCLACLYAHTPGLSGPDEFGFRVTLVLPCAESEVKDVQRVWDETQHPGATPPRIGCTAEPQSFAQNVNFGVSQTQDNVIVLLNSDCYVGPGWLDALLRPMILDAKIVATGPMGTNVSGHQAAAAVALSAVPTVGDCAATARRWAEEMSGRPIYRARRLVGFCLAVHRPAWDQAGGLDERFINAYDDDDLCLRLWLTGGECVVVPDLLVLHEGSASFRELPDAEAGYNRTLFENQVRFSEKWWWIMEQLSPWLAARGAR